MNLIIGVCVFLLIGFSCDNGNDQIEPVSTLELRLAKEGWRRRRLERLARSGNQEN